MVPKEDHMRRYIGMAILVALVLAANHWYGPIGLTRLIGTLFLCVGVYGCFAPSFSVSFGGTEIAKLTGWKKAAAIVPISALGLSFVLYAPAITCVSQKYKHLCG